MEKFFVSFVFGCIVGFGICNMVNSDRIFIKKSEWDCKDADFETFECVNVRIKKENQ